MSAPPPPPLLSTACIGRRLVQGALLVGVLSLVSLQIHHSVELSNNNLGGFDANLHIAESLLQTAKRSNEKPPTARDAGASTKDCHILPMNPEPPFDPFMDFQFQQPPKDESVPYSSVHCMGTGTTDASSQSEADSMLHARRPNFVSRSCQYRNLYYRITDQTFHYVASPKEAAVHQHMTGELHNRTAVSLGHVNDWLPPSKLHGIHVTPWQPIYHVQRPMTAPIKVVHIVFPHDPIFLLYHPYHSAKLSHFVWDDLLSLFSLLDLFDDDPTMPSTPTSRPKAIPLFVELANPAKHTNYGGRDKQFRCSPYHIHKWETCVSVYQQFYPILFGMVTDCSGDILRTGNWLQGTAPLGVWRKHDQQPCDKYNDSNNLAPPQTEWVRLPTVLVGTGRLNEFGCDGDCSIGRGSQFWRFRQHLLGHLWGWERADCPNTTPVGYITFSLPVGTSRPDQVTFFTEEIAEARRIYGTNAIQVVNLANLTMAAQADLMANTAVFVTNHGGGSFVSLFLPRHAGILLFWHGEKRLDHNFYESVGYFRTTWISSEERTSVDRTMALVAQEVERTALNWPDIIAAQQQQ